MASSRQTLRTDVEVETRDAQGNLRKLSRELDDVADSAGDAAKDAGKFEKGAKDAAKDTKKLEKNAKAAAVDVDKLADELKGATKKAKKFGDTSRKSGREAQGAFEKTEGSIHGTATAAGEAFGEGGGFQAGLGSAAEGVEQFAEMFGPAGVIISLVGGAAIGALVKFFDTAQEHAAATKEAVASMFDSLREEQGKALEGELLTDLLVDWNEKTGGLLVQWGKDYPEVMQHFGGAVGGVEDDVDGLTGAISMQIRKIQDQAHETKGLTLEQQAQIDELRKIEQEYRNLSGEVAGTRAETATLNAVIHGQEDAWWDAARAAVQSQGQIKDSTIGTASQVSRLEENIRRAQYAGAQGFGSTGRIGPTGAAGVGSGHAAGGPVSAGQQYTVGEYGPEQFVPATNGTIIPNGARGGGSVTINQTIVTNDPMRMARQTARALSRQAFRNGGG